MLRLIHIKLKAALNYIFILTSDQMIMSNMKGVVHNEEPKENS